MRPAELPVVRVEVVVAAPAVGADDPGEALSEQRPGLEAVAAGRDPEDRALAGQGAPQRPAGAGRLPAGLVDVDHRRFLELLLEPGVQVGERLPGAVHDRVDRPVASSTPNSSRASSVVSRRETRLRGERHDRCLQPRPERRPRHPAGSSARVRAAQSGQQTACSRCSLTRTAINGNSATWCRHGSTASTSSGSAKACAHERHRSGQWSTTSSTCSSGSSGRLLPSCPGWPPLAAGARPARPRRCRRWILRRRQRRVAQGGSDSAAQLADPRLQPLVRLDQLADPQQQRDRRLPIAVEDRLRLGPLHAAQVRCPEVGPCAPRVNAYAKYLICRTFGGVDGARTRDLRRDRPSQARGARQRTPLNGLIYRPFDSEVTQAPHG